jgi:F0F1-type ATP synthase membrane subunit b/b'
MCVLIFKLTYSKIRLSLENGIDGIKHSMENLEKRKVASDLKFNELQKDLAEAKQNVSKTLQEAKEKAKKIAEQAVESMNREIEQKQKEYDKNIERIKAGLYSELCRNISDMIIKEIEKKIKGMRTDMNLHEKLIDFAIDELEKSNLPIQELVNSN